MSDFKVDDLVVCLESSGEHLTQGALYSVTEVFFCGTLSLAGVPSKWCKTRFAKVKLDVDSSPRGIAELIKPEGTDELVEKKRLTMWYSLREAVNQAKGNPDILKLEMTLEELIDTLAQNDIQFIYKGGK